jgi:hypothetical protein
MTVPAAEPVAWVYVTDAIPETLDAIYYATRDGVVWSGSRYSDGEWFGGQPVGASGRRESCVGFPLAVHTASIVYAWAPRTVGRIRGQPEVFPEAPPLAAL